MTSKIRLLVLLAGVVAVLGLAACTSSDETPDDDVDGTATQEQPTIEANLTDGFLIDISAATASAGAVAFEVANMGQLLHEMLIIRTDLAEDALPVDGVAADESQLEVVAGTTELAPGHSQLLLTDLQAGAYVLICNIPGHYNAGMHRAFTVQ
jgi:uncharacterized cupredoxin-like copper-binding protein